MFNLILTDIEGNSAPIKDTFDYQLFYTIGFYILLAIIIILIIYIVKNKHK